MLEEYLKVNTGQDLLDLGVIPKDSSSHMALITKKRLEALRDKELSSLDEDILGRWIPLFVPDYQEIGPELDDPGKIREYIKEGMTVQATKDYENKSLKGIKGTVKLVRKDILGIEWEKDIGGSTLDGTAKNGHGWKVPYDHLKLIVPEGKIAKDYNLTEGVVANDQLGHRIRFTKTHEGKTSDRYGDKVDIRIPENSTGTLVEHNAKDQYVTIKFDKEIDVKGRFENKHQFTMPIAAVAQNMQVSSLGQMIPLDKEEEIKKQAFLDFFPRTVLEKDRAERILIGLLMNKDMIFDGPPGGGKTQCQKDLVSIAQQQEIIFTEKDCQVQCNPYSIFDADFAKIVPPCAECMIKYDKDYKGTGIFRRPKPKDVEVKAARYEEGHGIEKVAGSTKVNRMYLAGFKIPKLDGSVSEQNDYDPEGFKPGKLPRTNNGILCISELDKILPRELDTLLDALGDSVIMPDELRYEYPSNQLVIATANNSTVLSPELNDRLLIITIRYPKSEDVSYDITRRSYHHQFEAVESTPIGDTHKEHAIDIRDKPMPVIVERAIDAFYMKFRKEYTGKGKTPIMGSNRCKFDALDAARAYLLLDQIFMDQTPQVAGTEYAIKGIQYALCTRVTEKSFEDDNLIKKELSQWVQDEFEKVLRTEEDTWWCRAYKDVAIANNFIEELAGYEKDLDNAVTRFRQVKKAYDNPKEDAFQLARIDNPLMDYLFTNQPKFDRLDDDELKATIRYLISSRQNTHCKIGSQ